MFVSTAVKQERSPIRGVGPHPALRERGRAIPPGAPTPPSRVPVTMPPHARVRSPLSVYFETELDIKVSGRVFGCGGFAGCR